MKPAAKTYSAKPADFAPGGKKWLIVDADGKTLGRMAVNIANALRGKNRPEYTPHVDTGDFVVVINAEKVKLTGAKLEQKIYYRHTGYVGHLRSATAREMLEKKPEEVIMHAVKGMLPKNKLSQAMLKKLKVYRGPEHPHAAQKPAALEV